MTTTVTYDYSTVEYARFTQANRTRYYLNGGELIGQTCTRCMEDKPIDLFPKNQEHCRKCTNELVRLRRAEKCATLAASA